MPQKSREARQRDKASLPPAVVALDEAVRGISGVLEIAEVLQLIVDRVRDLVGAQYAALGIVNENGEIIEFITSGITAAKRHAIGDLPHGRGLLGLIIRENRSYRIPDIAAHPESYGFPAQHPAMRSFLGVPIAFKHDVVGRLYLTNKQGAAEFSAEDQALVETFALHAGIAIDSARLHEQVRRLAVVDERDRISRDLHDSIIQSIYGVTLSLDDVPDLVDESPSAARERVDAAIETLHGVIRDIRNFIFGLRPLLLDSGNLAGGLRILSDEIRRNTAIDVELEADLDEDLPMAVVAELLAIAREALANVARHSGAEHAAVGVAIDRGIVRLTIHDDGRGVALGTVAAGGHHGLGNMRARAEALGGTFTLSSEPAGGTRIIVAVPGTGRPPPSRP
jgi:two-component system, NarL family, sensor histidine kinase DevS